MDMNSQEKKKGKAAMINLGCKVNKYEADSMKDRLLLAGYEIVEPEEKADVYIVNTCSVTNIAQKKSRQMLRRAKRRNPEAVIVAAGCYVNAEHDTLKGEDFVDIVVGNNCKKDIVTAIDEFRADKSLGDRYTDISQTGEYEEMGSLAAAHMDHQRAYIKIQDGCNQFCSYCIIPYTRGRVRSRRAEHIIEEVRRLAKEGVKEFVLTGIHISSYGIDWKEKNVQYDDMIMEKEEILYLGDLVKAVAEVPEVERIRLGSLEPRIITEAFLEGLKGNEKFCPHFHLSLQSACNDTLRRMNRKYTVEEFMEKCERIRAYFDRPAITTDVIVGFPGETEAEFAVTLDNLKKLGLYQIHVFPYSVRVGTLAERLPNPVPEREKRRRSDILRRLTAEQKEAYECAMRGYTDEVLVEERLSESDLKKDWKEVEIAGEKEQLSEKKQEMDRADSVSVKLQEKGACFTGHTKRYVKVKVWAEDDIINQVVKVKFS